MRQPYFSSQAEAVKAAREFFWGDVPFARRECLYPDHGVKYVGITVSANVNGRLIVIEFDNYGRVQPGTIKVLDKVSK